MPDGRSHKSYDDYGPHDYGEGGGTSDCKYGCGCWMGPARSDGPPGIDPFGHCPDNPVDGQRQPGKEDYEDCVNGLIKKLESELYAAKESVKIVETAKKSTKVDLACQLEEKQEELSQIKILLKKALYSIQSISQEISSKIEN